MFLMTIGSFIYRLIMSYFSCWIINLYVIILNLIKHTLQFRSKSSLINLIVKKVAINQVKMLHRTFLSAIVKNNGGSISCAKYSTAIAARTMLPAVSILHKQMPQNSNNFICNTQTRFNSSSVAKKLQEVLQEEIKAEKELETNNMGTKVQPEISGFKIAKKDAKITLTKTHGNEKILVTVIANRDEDNQDHQNEYEEFAEMEEGGGEAAMQEEKSESIPVLMPSFTVEITKGEQRLVFYLVMVKSEETGGYDFDVGEFLIAPAAKGEKQEDLPEETYSSSGTYIEPKLHQLLLNYLEERGINAQFCHSLVQYATHYEHQQYVQLLEKLKKFVGQN